MSKLGQIQALFPQHSCCIAWERAAFVISNPFQTKQRPPEQCQWIAVCMHACMQTLCFPITELWLAHPAPPRKALSTAGTKYHQITSLFGLHNRTTDPCCMPQIQGLRCLHQPDSRLGTQHSSTVWVTTRKEYRCMMLVWKESVHVYSLNFPAAPVVRPLTGSDVS